MNDNRDILQGSKGSIFKTLSLEFTCRYPSHSFLASLLLRTHANLASTSVSLHGLLSPSLHTLDFPWPRFPLSIGLYGNISFTVRSSCLSYLPWLSCLCHILGDNFLQASLVSSHVVTETLTNFLPYHFYQDICTTAWEDTVSPSRTKDSSAHYLGGYINYYEMKTVKYI